MSEIIESLRATLAVNPQNWETRYSLIHALHQEGRTNEAVELLNGITELPTDDRSIVFAAQSYHILGAKDQAESVYRTALQMNPNNESAKAGLRSLGIEPDPTPLVAVAAPTAEPLAVVSLDEGEAVPVAKAIPVSDTGSARPVISKFNSPPPVITKDDTIPYDPESAELMDQISESEEESRRRYAASVRRDRINAIVATILVHIGLVVALSLVIKAVPRAVPPKIVASSSAETPDDTNIEQQVLQKNSLKASPSQNSAANIISVASTSSISMTSMDSIQGTEAPMTETGMTFQPSMSMGMPSAATSMMMFGQPLEGETLGVVLDVSGSMAEWLPLVIREVDRNFKDAPIVYVTDARIQASNRQVEIRPIVKEEVVQRRADGTHSPFWFLWGDLPRKAPQRSVDRLIETFKTRKNQFIALGEQGHWRGGDRLGEAMKFLSKEGCDAVYVFSDFEDFIDEDQALEHGRLLAKRKVRAYIQPAVAESEFIAVMNRKVAARTKGRQLPTLASVVAPKDDKPAPLVPKPPSNEVTMVEGVTYASPRAEQVGKEFYDFRPQKGWKEITRLEEPEFDAVFYGPEARAAIFLKNREGQYIQHPIVFGYHSHKELPDHPDTAYRWRRRKFLRVAEPPSFDGKEIVWKMILEDELKFDVHLYLDRKGMNATYLADLPEDDTADNAYIYFSVPSLAKERNDRYYGQDLSKEGLTLNQVRQYAKRNEVVFNLPRQVRDRYGKEWEKLGFQGGYNTRTFDTLITRYPQGVRDLKISGDSFGPRIFNARTTSSKVLLNAGAWRADTEPWEGFHARLHRSKDRRTRFTKTEAIAISIE